MRFRSHAACIAFVLALVALSALSLQGAADAEDELKCAALLAFIQNSHWTEQPSSNTPLTVGVLGRPLFLRGVRNTLEGKVVEGRPLRIVEVAAQFDPRCCQVVYFATGQLAEIKTALQSVSSEHVLTVGETSHFLEQGGAVNLFLADGHMAFEVSLEALNRSGVTVSSRLLRFGQIRDLQKGRARK